VLEHLPHPITRVVVAVVQVQLQEEHLQAQMVVMAAQELQAITGVSPNRELMLVVVVVEPMTWWYGWNWWRRWWWRRLRRQQETELRNRWRWWWRWRWIKLSNPAVAIAGGNGGSGVVVIKIPDTKTATFTGGVTSSGGSPSGGYKIYTVTATSTTNETVTFS
jgi:hypothetical protein